MPEEFDYIERYFEGKFSPTETIAFERRIEEDPSFAEQLAFYVSTLRVARQQADNDRKIRFRKIYEATPVAGKQAIMKRFWPYISAAAVIAAVVISLFVFYRPAGADKLADIYVQQHLRSLPVTMDNSKNDFITGTRLYNDGKLREALVSFESTLRADSANYKARENAGISYLRLAEYDKALHYFKELESYPNLYANPGKFYHALTLLKRNRSGDAGEARRLLREVVSNHLDLDNDAAELLEKLR